MRRTLRPVSMEIGYLGAGQRMVVGPRCVHGGGDAQPLIMILLILSLGAQLSLQQDDPVSNFCRRFGHQAAIIDDRLYIDGGFINYNPLEEFPTNYTSESFPQPYTLSGSG